MTAEPSHPKQYATPPRPAPEQASPERPAPLRTATPQALFPGRPAAAPRTLVDVLDATVRAHPDEPALDDGRTATAPWPPRSSSCAAG